MNKSIALHNYHQIFAKILVVWLVCFSVGFCDDNLTLGFKGIYSLWNTDVKAGLTDSSPAEVGVKFKTKVDGSIKAIRYYREKPNDSGYFVHLWSETGELLGTGKAFEGQQPTPGWQVTELYPPVPVKAGVVYVASYYCGKGQFSVSKGFFTDQPIENGPLVALSNIDAKGGNGILFIGLGGGFPTKTMDASNFWVDVVFSP